MDVARGLETRKVVQMDITQLFSNAFGLFLLLSKRDFNLSEMKML